MGNLQVCRPAEPWCLPGPSVDVEDVADDEEESTMEASPAEAGKASNPIPSTEKRVTLVHAATSSGRMAGRPRPALCQAFAVLPANGSTSCLPAAQPTRSSVASLGGGQASARPFMQAYEPPVNRQVTYPAPAEQAASFAGRSPLSPKATGRCERLPPSRPGPLMFKSNAADVASTSACRDEETCTEEKRAHQEKLVMSRNGMTFTSVPLVMVDFD